MFANFPLLSKPAFVGRSLCYVMGGAAFYLALSGCSVSHSISDSVSSPFKWSSDSSGCSSDERDESYRNDIRDYTVHYVNSNKDVRGLREGIGSIALRHGVTDWEADTASYEGIGAGLAKANASKGEVDHYASALSDGEPVKTAAIKRGYLEHP